MMGNYHVRCGAGEKPEVLAPEAYLSLFGQIPNFDKLIYLSSLRRKRRRVVTEDEPFDLYDIELSDEDFTAE